MFWATPVALKNVAPYDIENLYEVAPKLYRSAQPNADGLKAAVEQLSLKTIISLRRFHDDQDERGDTKVELVRVPMEAYDIDINEVRDALSAIDDALEKGPVLFHCLHGADRTGMVAALYRITRQGWDREEAIREMEQGGFNYHSIWVNIPKFIRNVDLSTLK